MEEITHISEIYDNFLSKISDYSLLDESLTATEIDEELFSYFKSARNKFHKCKTDLKTVVDDFTGEHSFTVELHPYEIEILTTLMLVEYISPNLISSETIRQTLSDKDFRIYSQANQLRELRLLKKDLKSEANKMITKYTFFDLGKNK